MAGIKTVDLAAAVLYELSRCEDAIGVREMSRRVGASKSTTQRIMTTLEGRSLLTRSNAGEKYRLGPGVVQLAAGALERGETIATVMPFMTALRDETGETVCLHGHVEWKRITLAQVESRHELRWIQQIGVPRPLHRGASSKCVMASLPPADQHIVMDREEVVDREALLQELRSIRASGWAVSREDRVPGGAAIAACIPTDTGLPLAIGVCGPESRMPAAMVERTLTVLLDTVQEIARALRHRV
ncbi:MAG: IclR family transcriptional regulator [Chloroflexota bacterium]